MKKGSTRLFLITIVLLIGSMAWVIPGQANEVVNAVVACQGLTLENPTPSPTCVAAMEASLKPAVSEVPLDGFTLSNYTYWRVQPDGPTNIYDAPNGNITRVLDPGFNFVIVIDQQDDWVQINGGEWVHTEDVKLYEPSFFKGVTLLNNLDQPFGWVMDTLLSSPYPGASQKFETGTLYKRYDRVNIFASVELDGWNWYMVGPNQWLEQRVVALAKKVERPTEIVGRWVAIDLYEQTLVAYENDTPVYATLVATGLPGWDTREGVFEVWARATSDPMSGAAGAPDFYALQNVPWVMYFDGGISMHGTYWHDGFGFRRSHGCVNLTISDARYLFEWTGGSDIVDEEGNPITHVFVWASGEYHGSGPQTK